MTRDFHFADHSTADQQDLRNDGGVIHEHFIAFFQWQLAGDPASAGRFEGEAHAVRTDPVWSPDIK